MVVSEVGVSIAQVGLVGLEASFGVVSACHGSDRRADGFGGLRGVCAARAHPKLGIEFSAFSAGGTVLVAVHATGRLDSDQF